MTREVTFHFSLLSPWVYLGWPRFEQLVRETGARVRWRPIDLLRVFRETGGTPLRQLHPSRKAYRAVERTRWAALLGLPISAEPRFHPTDESLAGRLMIALHEQDPQACWRLGHAILAAVWVRDLDIAQPATLHLLAREQGLDADTWLARAQDPATLRVFEANTADAIAAGVFGVPSFVVDGELYFGQDRLDFVERALRA